MPHGWWGNKCSYSSNLWYLYFSFWIINYCLLLLMKHQYLQWLKTLPVVLFLRFCKIIKKVKFFWHNVNIFRFCLKKSGLSSNIMVSMFKLVFSGVFRAWTLLNAWNVTYSTVVLALALRYNLPPLATKSKKCLWSQGELDTALIQLRHTT